MFAPSFALLSFVLLSLWQTTSGSAASPFDALTVYEGAWTMAGGSAAGARPDNLVNHCALTEAFFSCEQVVNGKPSALIIFTAADTPNTFHTQTVLPSGFAVGRGDLMVAGDHWTYRSKAQSVDGKSTTFYRTENLFTGRDRIHYEQYESADGNTWQKKMSGDEIRVGTK